MSIFDIFSGEPGRRAATATMNTIQQNTGQATNAIQQGLAAATPMYQQGRDALAGTYGAALTALQNQYPQTQQYLGQAAAAYQPMINQGQQGLSTYMDAVGANGPEGNARGVANFRADPGYEFARGQAEQGVLRTAASRGMLAGGNTTADLASRLTGLADQTYGNYVSRLAPLVSMYGQGVQGQAGAYGAQGQASQNQGTGLAGANMNYGNALAGNLAQQAGANTQAGANQAQVISNATQPLANAMQGGMMAGQQGNANAWGALFGGANLLRNGLFGGGSSGGGSGGMPNFGNMFGFSGLGG